MKPLSDTDPMPFGMHKGIPMQDVPASYLHWIWTTGRDKRAPVLPTQPVFDYIQRNIAALKEEYPDGIWT